MVFSIPSDLPYEIKEMILMHLDTYTIQMMGEKVVYTYVWERKKDETIEEAVKNNNLVGMKYLIEICTDFKKCRGETHSKYTSALRLSAELGHINIIEYLITTYSKNV